MVFWQVIIILSAVAAVFVLWPLVQLPFLHKSWEHRTSHDDTQLSLYREHLADLDAMFARGDMDEAQYTQLKTELQKTLVAEDASSQKRTFNRKGKKIVLAASLLVPVVAFALYSHWGAKADWDIYQDINQLGQITSPEDYEQSLRALILKTQARLNKTPDNLSLRNLLAQTSMALQDYDEAVANYRKILEQYPDSPRVMANLAQALFYRAGNTITPEVREYTQKSLALAPMMPEMLGLAGIDAKNQGDLRGAIRYWTLAVSQLPPGSAAARGYQNGIDKAEQALIARGESLDEPEVTDSVSESTEAGEGTEPGGAANSVTLKVALSDAVALKGTETVFVYARAWQGPKVPLAIKRLTVSDLPVEVTLDESMAMAPGMTIAQFEELELVARVSLSGSPAAQRGDWQATKGPVKLQELSGPVQLTIADQVP